MSLHELLIDQGYRIVEDAWNAEGRVTYVHGDDADRPHLAYLTRVLAPAGWTKSPDKLRSFNGKDEEIEVEPGGSDTSGHFLHHMKCRVTS